MGKIAIEQDMSDCRDWDKLTDQEKSMFYGLLADIQNNLGDIQRSFDERNSGIKIYEG